jgi:nicotinic acid phosphoribosyltransferase
MSRHHCGAISAGAILAARQIHRATVSAHEEKKMTIEFTGRRHIVAASRVAFEAKVSGKEVWCSVSMDALNDHFGNTGTSSHELIQSFEANRPRIEAAAQRVLERNGGQSVELETRDLD